MRALGDCRSALTRALKSIFRAVATNVRELFERVSFYFHLCRLLRFYFWVVLGESLPKFFD